MGNFGVLQVLGILGGAGDKKGVLWRTAWYYWVLIGTGWYWVALGGIGWY